jgi:hypothetical protein
MSFDIKEKIINKYIFIKTKRSKNYLNRKKGKKRIQSINAKFSKLQLKVRRNSEI